MFLFKQLNTEIKLQTNIIPRVAIMIKVLVQTRGKIETNVRLTFQVLVAQPFLN